MAVGVAVALAVPVSIAVGISTAVGVAVTLAVGVGGSRSATSTRSHRALRIGRSEEGDDVGRGIGGVAAGVAGERGTPAQSSTCPSAQNIAATATPSAEPESAGASAAIHAPLARRRQASSLHEFMTLLYSCSSALAKAWQAM
ncbi:MAG TPA: hypothetical protein VL049_29935 [Candidatus Dormibacteraeota bacterium]|nr:hypothetical protein [Candidatus Dormibacteraeota bacterium]